MDHGQRTMDNGPLTTDPQPSTVVADTHVHLYSCYDLSRAIECASRNLAQLCDAAGATQAERVICLTESHGCHVFQNLVQGAARLDGQRFHLEGPLESSALRI